MPLFILFELDRPEGDAERDAGGDDWLQPPNYAAKIRLAANLLDSSNNRCGTLSLVEADCQAQIYEGRNLRTPSRTTVELIVRRFELGVTLLPEIGPPTEEAADRQRVSSAAASDFYVFFGIDSTHRPRMRDEFRSAHTAYVKGNRELIALAGRVLDDENTQCASFNVFAAADEQHVREWREHEPYFKSGVVFERIMFHRALILRNRLPKKAWQCCNRNGPRSERTWWVFDASRCQRSAACPPPAASGPISSHSPYN